MQSGRNLLDQAGRVVGQRQVRYGSNALLMTLIFLAILAVINVIATQNHVRWDLTASGDFSLSPQTIEIIQSLEQPVEIIGFYTSQQQGQQDELETRLQEYTSRSNQISYRFIDPEVNPAAVQQYGVPGFGGTMVLQSGDRTQQITAITEQAITGAIVKVTQENPTTVFFLTGHNERSIDGFEEDSYGRVRQVLEDDNYIVQTISLVISDTIPLENSVLVIADPQSDLSFDEVTAINTYLSNGGRLLLLSNPFAPLPLPTVMKQFGLQWRDDVLIDQRSLFNNPFAPALDVGDYPFSDITSDLNGPTVFPTTRTISQTTTPAGIIVTPLLTSSPASQGATDFDEGEVRPVPTDPQGPLTFGFSAEGALAATDATTDTIATTPSARLVVIGDADFVSNGNFNLPTANPDLFRSAIGWLATQDDAFTLPPREQPVDRSLLLTSGQGQFVFYMSTLGLPLLVVLAGIYVWWQRR